MKLDKTLTYSGPNLRSDDTAIEREVELTCHECDRLKQASIRTWRQRLERLDPALVLLTAAGGDGADDPAVPDTRLGRVYSEAAIALQRAAGHRVSGTGLIPPSAPDRCRFWFEYEEPDTGLGAAKIVHHALELLLDPATDPDSPQPGSETARSDLRQRIRQFREAARKRAMPADCGAIVCAAVARGIPVMRMDRPPYNPITGDFRLRYNALLRLGHGHYQHTVDGTFCVSRSVPVFELVRDRYALFRRLSELDVVMPGGDASAWCQSPLRAGRLAERIGYPVTLRAGRRQTTGITGPLEGREAVRRAAQVALHNNAWVLIQPWLPGTTFKLVIAAGGLVGVYEQIGKDEPAGWRKTPEAHPSITRIATRIATALQVGLMTVTVVTSRVNISLQDGGGAVVDVELAPELDRLFTPDDPFLHQAAAAFVEWIYPDPALSRIPIIAVTGTNGKTTTSRMIHRILAATDPSAGLACSDGSMVGDKIISDMEDGHLYGHRVVLDNPKVSIAVLETTRGSAGTTGLGFDRCDVAVCLNVTADHLNDILGTRTVAELAALKRTILERAGQAVVINADDNLCLDMIPFLDGRTIGLVSVTQTPEQLRQLSPGDPVVCVLESRQETPWIVIHHGTNTVPVIAVNDIPLTFHGAAEHNVSNALHGALAAHLMGLDAGAIARGLSELPATFDASPGRLSFHHGFSFDICMDYAHNPAGMRALCRFTNRLPVKGRRMICLSCSNQNSDEFIRETAAEAANSFDHYICKNFSQIFDRPSDQGPALLREGLTRAGVPAQAITCIEDESEAVNKALAMARAGDLLVIIGGKRRQALWKQITDAATAQSSNH